MSSEWKSENWIAASLDRLHRGRHVLLGIDEWIFRQRSEYQEVAIASIPQFGRGLFLDAVLELAESDEFIYHESVALPPLLFHPRPRRVLVEGGGDGLALREVLRDPRVEDVVVVELDALVVDACREHLRELHRGSFDDPRTTLLIRDVFPYLESGPPPFDVILVDLLDGYDDAAVALYREVLSLSHRALAPGGIVAGFGDLSRPRVPLRYVHRELVDQFAHVVVHRAAIESFTSEYGFVLASDDVPFEETPSQLIVARAASLSGELRALVPAAFPSSFRLPLHIARALEENGPPPESALSASFSWLPRA